MESPSTVAARFADPPVNKAEGSGAFSVTIGLIVIAAVLAVTVLPAKVAVITTGAVGVFVGAV